MKILKVDSEAHEVTLILDATELVSISNSFYKTWESDDSLKKDKFRRLYANITLAKSLCQDGSINNFDLAKMVELRGIDNVMGELPYDFRK